MYKCFPSLMIWEFQEWISCHNASGHGSQDKELPNLGYFFDWYLLWEMIFLRLFPPLRKGDRFLVEIVGSNSMYIHIYGPLCYRYTYIYIYISAYTHVHTPLWRIFTLVKILYILQIRKPKELLIQREKTINSRLNC